MTIIDCISDLHGHYPILEGGDLLIVAGDLTARDTLEQHSDILNWLHKQNYKKKVLIGGNHDQFLQDNPNFYSKTNIDYLCDSGTEFEGLKLWGSPWSLKFPGMNPYCMAFTCETEDQLAEKCAMIPEDIDILITHSAPLGILDYLGKKNRMCESLSEILGGSMSLREATCRINPKLHIFGHIHENGGTLLDTNLTKFINASHVNEHYQPINKPVRVIL